MYGNPIWNSFLTRELLETNESGISFEHTCFVVLENLLNLIHLWGPQDAMELFAFY